MPEASSQAKAHNKIILQHGKLAGWYIPMGLINSCSLSDFFYFVRLNYQISKTISVSGKRS